MARKVTARGPSGQVEDMCPRRAIIQGLWGRCATFEVQALSRGCSWKGWSPGQSLCGCCLGPSLLPQGAHPDHLDYGETEGVTGWTRRDLDTAVWGVGGKGR